MATQRKRSLENITGAVQLPHKSRINSRIILIAVLLMGIALSLKSIYQNDQRDHELSMLVKRVQAEPDRGDAHRQLGEYYEKQFLLEQAKYEYNLARQFGDPLAPLRIGRVEQKQQYPNEVRQAITVWQSFLVQHPDYKDGWLMVATWWYELGDKQQSMVALEKVLALDPEYPPALQLQKLY